MKANSSGPMTRGMMIDAARMLAGAHAPVMAR
jgi:hypothetical protein